MDEKLQDIKRLINLHLSHQDDQTDRDFAKKLAEAVAELTRNEVSFYQNKPTVSGYGQ